MSWCTEIQWKTPAGEVLLRLVEELPRGCHYEITVFGSSPIQLGIEPSFASNDVDIFADENRDEVQAAIRRAGLEKDHAKVFVQCCYEANFRAGPRWRRRLHRVEVDHCTILLPHPVDILIAKLHRLEEKDLRAFRLVIERTGHPTEDEFREELQAAVDLFRPNFDESVPGDITTNTRVLWLELWAKDIDVRKEIIAPALARIREGYAPDLARADYKAELRRLSES